MYFEPETLTAETQNKFHTQCNMIKDIIFSYDGWYYSRSLNETPPDDGPEKLSLTSEPSGGSRMAKAVSGRWDRSPLVFPSRIVVPLRRRSA